MPYTLLNQPTMSFWEDRAALLPLDFDAVGTLFRAKLAAKKKLSGATAVGPSGGLAVIDMKRATSVGVIMSKLSVPHSRLGKAVFELDASVRYLVLDETMMLYAWLCLVPPNGVRLARLA
jgi:hypothetical protein